MTQKKQGNLGYLGECFQYKLVNEFMANHTFFEDLNGIVDQNMFTDPNLKTFVGVMKNYFEREGQVPSYDYMEIELRGISHSDKETETYLAVLDKIKKTPTDGVNRTREHAEKFFRQQNIIKTANEILRIAGNGDIERYEDCVGLLNDAMTKGTHNDFGEGVFDHLNETLSNDYRIPVPTGIGKVDETLEGGLGKGELGVIIGPSGFGKAQPLDSRILTPNGYKLMGDMHVGDYVVGCDGQPHRVSGVFPQGKRPIYKVSFSNGTSCECDIEHLWNVNSLYQRCGKKNVLDHSFKTLTLKEILNKGLIKGEKYNFKVPVVKPINFTEKEIKFDPYFVGYYSNYHAENKFIPEDYLYNSIGNRIAVLQGIMDSDGHVNNDGSCEFYSESKQLALDVQFLVRSLGGFATLVESDSSYLSKKRNEKKNCGKKYRVTINMCDSSIPLFRLERKQEKVKYRDKYADSLFMTNAEYIGEKEAQCIMVDSDEHLYVTEDFIVTHNTSMTTAMASHAALSGFKVLQIVFEDRIKQIQRKHIGRLTGIEAKDLSKEDNIEKVKETLKHFQDDGTLQENLRIVKFPSGEKTARQIKAFIVKLINSGFKPDLVILDYFECLAHEGGSSMNDYEKEGKTMRFFEAMVGELDIAMWIPSQGTKDSINLELITMDKIGGSVKKAQIAHVILSIARTVDDIANNKATIAILKNRAGKSGKIFNNVDFNNGTCIISTDSVDEFDSMFAKKKSMQEENQKVAIEIFRSLSNNSKKNT